VAPKTKITFANVTDVGLVRRQNEDSAIVCEPGEDLASKMGYLVAVADGMGGHAAGEIAADLALRELVQRYYSFEGIADPKSILRTVIGEVNAEVFDQAQTQVELNAMGTTLVCAVIKDDLVWIANVGDSRAYLIRGGIAIRLTKDHSWEEEQGLSREEAKRSPFRGVITRAIGKSATVEVDVFTDRLQPGDVLLLCSDGLTKHVPDGTIGKQISHIHDLRKACFSLIRIAKQYGGTDNVTIVAAAMAKVRKRVDRIAVSRAFPDEMMKAQKAIMRRRRTAEIVIGIIIGVMLFFGSWGFGALEPFGLSGFVLQDDEEVAPKVNEMNHRAAVRDSSTDGPRKVANEPGIPPGGEKQGTGTNAVDSKAGEDSLAGAARTQAKVDSTKTATTKVLPAQAKLSTPAGAQKQNKTQQKAGKTSGTQKKVSKGNKGKGP
jgi:protein phosphatase